MAQKLDYDKERWRLKIQRWGTEVSYHLGAFPTWDQRSTALRATSSLVSPQAARSSPSSIERPLRSSIKDAGHDINRLGARFLQIKLEMFDAVHDYILTVVCERSELPGRLEALQEILDLIRDTEHVDNCFRSCLEGVTVGVARDLGTNPSALALLHIRDAVSMAYECGRRSWSAFNLLHKQALADTGQEFVAYVNQLFARIKTTAVV
jgi:hypothetical protein